ncbi:MAG TPA: hypothetical protein VFI06_01920 [Chitinophagaceae bacterium]|nr:hypothetical protein [Chitinophagaceae bacterium]
MKKFLQVMTGVVVLAGIGVWLIRKINTGRTLDQVADNGYETAHDVLFPKKNIRSRKVRYGPVHPDMN